MKDFKLCYIHGDTTYFTTQDVKTQWGDDWDDAPYEHNAGTPYEPAYHYYADGRTEKVDGDWNEDGSPKWEIYTLKFDCYRLETPASRWGGRLRGHGGNSPYSVQMINNKLIPWLTVYPDKALFAGASIDSFVEFIEESGGEVFFPKSLIIQVN